MTDLTETAVARRVPAILEERLRVLSRGEPVTVPPATSLADCLRAIQRTGTGDSVFVCDQSGRLIGVLTERDIFARIVAGRVDLAQPVETLMTTEPRTLYFQADGTRRVYRVDPRGIEAIRNYLDRFWDRALAAFKAAAERETDS